MVGVGVGAGGGNTLASSENLISRLLPLCTLNSVLFLTEKNPIKIFNRE
jgi:hypothetical protein